MRMFIVVGTPFFLIRLKDSGGSKSYVENFSRTYFQYK
jgi:hypothetical protein